MFGAFWVWNLGIPKGHALWGPIFEKGNAPLPPRHASHRQPLMFDMPPEAGCMFHTPEKQKLWEPNVSSNKLRSKT